MRDVIQVASSRAVLWFFGFLVAIFIGVGIGLLDASDLSIQGLLLWAAVFGGFGFALSWHNYAREEFDLRRQERELAIEERRMELLSGGSGCE